MSESLSVFSTPREASDALPQAATKAASSLVQGVPDSVTAKLRTGDLQLDEGRLLLSNLGSAGADFYAFPTEGGNVCYVITGGPVGCESVKSFEVNLVPVGEFDPDGPGVGTPMALYGLLPDDVTAVSVTDSEGVSRPAEVGSNAYFLEMSNQHAWPVSLSLRYADGATRTMVVPGGAPPGVS